VLANRIQFDENQFNNGSKPSGKPRGKRSRSSHCIIVSGEEVCSAVSRGGHVPAGISPSEAVASSSSMTSNTPYDLPLSVWKVILQLCLTAINVIFWLLPLQNPKLTENKLVLSLANAFSGGIFLCLAFGHMIPECIHAFEDSSAVLPCMMVLSGYLLIFFIEKVAFDAHSHNHLHLQCSSGHNGSLTQPSYSLTDPAKPTLLQSESKKPKVSKNSAVILLFALGLHSILEMMALGLASNFNDSFLLFISIALHQPAESVALLVSFLKSGLPDDRIFEFLSIFSCLGPIGTALGMVVKQYTSPFVDALMLAMVSGTFVYVGATEIIPEEWEDSENRWLKFFSLISGIITIFVITQYTATISMEAS